MRSNIARTWPSSRTPGVAVALTAAYESPRSDEMNVTSALNCSGGSDLNDGIGDVGLISVRAIACLGSRLPTSVSGGPGPSLPLSPILWQARQPACAATSRPALYCATILLPWATMFFGGGMSIAVVEPACAPL